MLDMARAREVFEASRDFTIGIEEEFAILDPQTRSLVPRYEELRDAAQADDRAGGRGGGRADLLGDRDPLPAPGQLRRRAGGPAREPRAAVPPGRGPRRAAGGYRHPPVEPLAGAAHHRDRALPAAARAARLRRLPQQHVLRARARGHPRRGPGDRGLRPVAGDPPRAARDLRQLAVPGRPRLRPPLRAHPDLHEELPALRDPRRLRRLGLVRGLRRPPQADELHRRAHPALVERPAPPRLRHGRGADLRRPVERRGVDRAGGPGGRLRRPGGARLRRRRATRVAVRTG